MEPLAAPLMAPLADQLAGAVDATLIVFARVGACAMAMPGIGSARVLARARLLFAIALSAALAPLVQVVSTGEPFALARMLAAEGMVGLLLGLFARVHLAALRFAVGAVAGVIGFSPLGGIAAEDGAPDGPLATMIGLGALMALLAAGGHHLILRALIDTYGVQPVGAPMDPRANLAALTDALAAAYALALAVCGPILVYGVVMQLVVGLVNKLAPAVPLYFVAIPIVLAGGLLMAATIVPDMLLVHLDALPRTLLGR